MESDPVRFVWRQARALNGWLVAIAILCVVPLVWGAFGLLRQAVDVVLGGHGLSREGTAPFLRVAFALPERIVEAPIVLAPGIPLARASFVTADMAALAALACGAAGLVWIVGRLRGAIATRAAASLRERLVDAIVSAPLGAGEGARHAARLAGEVLADGAGFLGRAIAVPALAGAALLAGGLTVGRTDWRMGLGLLVGLALVSAASQHRHAADAAFVSARLAAGATLRRRLETLARRLPAMAAHGTAAPERAAVRRDVGAVWAPVTASERRLALGSALSTLAMMAGPLGVLALGLGAGAAGRLTPGSVVTAVAAAGFCVALTQVLLAWRRDVARFRPVFQEIARALGGLKARRSGRAFVDLPASGPLVAENLSASGHGQGGGRLTGLDLTLHLPEHIALTGEAGSGARLFAALIGGLAVPSAGDLRLGDVDLRDGDPAVRARRLAVAGGEPHLVPGSLRANLLYGCPDPDAPDIEARLRDAIAVSGLEAFVQARGLSATFEARQNGTLADAIVGARDAVRAALADPDFEGLVEPFDAERYNGQASIGENILFGVPIGDTFAQAHLAAQPFMRGILEREGLSKPLAALGAAIAQSTLEVFAELPNRNPLVERFAPVASTDRGDLERLLERRRAGGRGAAATRDNEQLIGLALRYVETRQRLGLLGPDLADRIVAARRRFSDEIPDSLRPAIDFLAPDRVCAAASLRDNLLFGRVAADRAGAEAATLGLIRRVLHDRGLDDAVVRLGLESGLAGHGGEPAPADATLVDLARCLVRRPDTLIVERALDGLSRPDAAAAIGRLAEGLAGRGLIVVVPDGLDGAVLDRFDSIVAFEGGRATLQTRDRRDDPSGADPRPGVLAQGRQDPLEID